MHEELFSKEKKSYLNVLNFRINLRVTFQINETISIKKMSLKKISISKSLNIVEKKNKQDNYNVVIVAHNSDTESVPTKYCVDVHEPFLYRNPALFYLMSEKVSPSLTC